MGKAGHASSEAWRQLKHSSDGYCASHGEKVDHVAGLEAWSRAQRVNSACGRHCVNPVCSSGSIAFLGRRVWLWCAPNICNGASLPPSLTEGRAGHPPMGASSTRVSKRSCHGHNCISFYFLWPRAAACAVTSHLALVLGQCCWGWWQRRG